MASTCPSRSPNEAVVTSMPADHWTLSVTDFTINCLECSIAANLSLSAGGNLADIDTFDAPPDVMEIPSDFDFKDHWAAATFDSFDAVFELSVDLSASSPHNEIIVPIPLGKAFTISKKVKPTDIAASNGSY